MGRYTTVQTFADNNQRVAALPYEKASGGVKADPDARAPGVRVPVVQNVSGSTAGAGSSHFHVYRLERRREEERLKNMDASHEAMLSNQEYHARLEANRLECEARTQKRAEKRKREKAAKGLKKTGARQGAVLGAPAVDGDDTDEDGANEMAEAAAAEAPGAVGAAAAAAGADGPGTAEPPTVAAVTSSAGDDLLVDDGNFLERFLRLKKQAAAAAAEGGTTEGAAAAVVEGAAAAPAAAAAALVGV